MWSRKVGKIAKPVIFNIGLLCSKTFDDRIFEELFEAKYGIKRTDIKKVNIKGVFQIWLHDGSYHEVPLKECHGWTREGCNYCPDFGAEHADISTGGIGKYNDWTLTVVRTELGRAVIDRMVAAGRIETRPGSDDPDAIKLMNRLSRVSRKRWPEAAIPFPAQMPPPKKKAAPAADAPAAARTARPLRRQTSPRPRSKAPAPHRRSSRRRAPTRRRPTALRTAEAVAAPVDRDERSDDESLLVRPFLDQ